MHVNKAMQPTCSGVSMHILDQYTEHVLYCPDLCNLTHKCVVHQYNDMQRTDVYVVHVHVHCECGNLHSE